MTLTALPSNRGPATCHADRRRVAMFAIQCLLITAFSTPSAAQNPPPSPLGLWRSTSDGMVMRIEACGAAFCGLAAGIPAAKANDARAPKCNGRMLRDHTWNEKSQRYEGSLSPPGTDRSIRSSLQTDGAARLVIRARMFMISKTLEFERFRGELGEACRIVAEAR
jgi:hypothetical protein